MEELDMRPPPYDPDDAPVGVCSECGKYCSAILLDFGIGSYEYWGSQDYEEHWRWVSPCCEAEVVESEDDYEDDEDNE